MSIEQTLERIATALEKIASRPSDQPVSEVVNTAPLSERTQDLPKAKSETKKSESKKQEPKAPIETTKNELQGGADSSEKVIPYDDVRNAIMNLSAEKGRAAAVALLGKFGAASGKDLKPEQFAKVIEAVDAEMLA